jgi:hypothetical protein
MSSAPTGLEVAAQRPGGGGVKKWLWIAAGAVLMALAVWMALRSGGMGRAVASLRDASPLVVAALLGLPAASWLLTSTLFWALTRRFGRVRWPEMCALIGASWLLNNLPLRPGMLGRVTYHRLVNEIPVLASVRVMVEALLCSALAGAIAVAVLAVASGEVAIGGAVMACGVVGAGVALAALRRRGTPLPVGLLALGTGIRVVDIAGWVVRYWLLLRLAGAPVSPMEAMGVTIASMLASMTPVQFGLREWAVGAAASLTGRSGAGGTMLSAGVSADVLNRGIELMLAIPIGLGAAWVISRRVRASRSEREAMAARGAGS